ncbi:MAG: ATP synthase subunit I [Caulobacteraceae bacterium]
MIVTFILLLLVFYNNKSIAFTYVLGGLACLGNFRLLIRSIEGMFGTRTHTKAFFNCFYGLRFLIVLFVLWCAVRISIVNLIFAMLGLMWLKLVITLQAIFINIKVR